MEFGKKLGDNIKKYMRAKGINEKEFGKILNYSENDIKRVLGGEVLAPPEEIKKYADIKAHS